MKKQARWPETPIKPIQKTLPKAHSSLEKPKHEAYMKFNGMTSGWGFFVSFWLRPEAWPLRWLERYNQAWHLQVTFFKPPKPLSPLDNTIKFDIKVNDKLLANMEVIQLDDHNDVQTYTIWCSHVIKFTFFYCDLI